MSVLKNEHHLGRFYNLITKNKPLLYNYQYILEFVEGGTYWEGGQWKKFDLFDHNDNDPANNFTYWAGGATIPSFDLTKAQV